VGAAAALARVRHAAALACALAACGCGGAAGPAPPTVDLAGVVPVEESWDEADLLHLQYVLDDSRQREFLERPPGERPELLRVAWAELDPTPTTALNERRFEHYRRLAYVREHFAIPDEPGWDRRGELLLRYGPPDERREIPGDVVVGAGLVPPKEVWVYGWLGAAFELEDVRLQGNFQDAFTRRGTSRVDVANDVSSLGIDEEIPVRVVDAQTGDTRSGRLPPVDAEEQMARERLVSMFQKGQEQIRERPRAYRHDYGGGTLDLVFDVQSFSDAGSGRSRVEVNTALWAKDLTFRPEGEGRVAVLEVEAALKTREFRDVERVAKTTRDHRGATEDLAGRMLVDQVVMVVAPGPYRLALSVQDSLSRDIGVYQTEIEVPAFPAGAFAMSEVQRALDVRSAAPDAPFVKGGLQIVPYPPGTYPRDRDIFLYFEIYGLALSPTGDALYTVQFLIRPRDVTVASWFGTSKGRAIPGVATAYDGAARSSSVQEYIALDPKTFTKGVYDVEVTVRDRVADRETSRSVFFGVSGD
jgi:GWxTD domain-containing protein